ncbi:MAG: zinc-dependent metalloprotease [Flavobacteriales bacterium]|nr:zinc-dependent metalloprotease [Flavobacteriales bacterium]MCB9175112.1 T9SS type A sorting domain-containing protein [Flavobacteriales bacterium]
MKGSILFFVGVLFFTLNYNAQNIQIDSLCLTKELIDYQLSKNQKEAQEKEVLIQQLIKKIKDESTKDYSLFKTTTYTIPVVLHVFHNGNDGKIDLDQAQSGIDILNNDFNGLNSDWNTIDPEFDSIKATLNIQFCLASIDPNGNPTTGVIYYQDSSAMVNSSSNLLYQHAWDNYKYFNIYLPKYSKGVPSDFTGSATLPDNYLSSIGRDGIIYSSIRWGYGTHSELYYGQEWASVGTHEVGHWLDLYHTFSNNCGDSGDLVADTPPTLGGTIYLSGCYNNNMSCGFNTNGENYMDYNHDCKKMFTQGQVDRMNAALYLPSRITIWSDSNLVATGCSPNILNTSELQKEHQPIVFPNPSNSILNFIFQYKQSSLNIYNPIGNLVYSKIIDSNYLTINVANFTKGIYFYTSTYKNIISNGKFVVE